MSHHQNDDIRVPVGEAFPSLRVHPDNQVQRLDFCFMLYKFVDAAGHPRWGYRTSGAPNLEELLGALQVQAELVKGALVDQWDDDEEGQ